MKLAALVLGIGSLVTVAVVVALLTLQPGSKEQGDLPPEGYGNAAVASLTYIKQGAYGAPDDDTLLQSARREASVVAGLQDLDPKTPLSDSDEQVRADLLELYRLRPRDVSPGEIVDAYIRGMVAAVPSSHAAYLPDGWQSLPTAHSGITMVATSEGARVWEVRQDSTGARAGILPGDIITAVNGIPPNEPIHSAEVDPLEITINRDGQVWTATVPYEVRGPSVFLGKRISPSTVYIRLASLAFENIGVFRVLSDTAFAIVNSAATTGVILDLRGNPGGDLQNAAIVAAKLNASGHFATFIDRTTQELALEIPPSSTALTNRSVVVLVDTGTSSAAEALAFTLREHGGARIVGEQTAGKVMAAKTVKVQTGILQLPTSLVLVGDARTNLEGVGVTPDIIVTLDFEALKRGEDNVIARAVELLSAP